MILANKLVTYQLLGKSKMGLKEEKKLLKENQQISRVGVKLRTMEVCRRMRDPTSLKVQVENS